MIRSSWALTATRQPVTVKTDIEMKYHTTYPVPEEVLADCKTLSEDLKAAGEKLARQHALLNACYQVLLNVRPQDVIPGAIPFDARGVRMGASISREDFLELLRSEVTSGST